MKSRGRLFVAFVLVLILCVLIFRYLSSHVVTNRYWHSGPIGEINHNAYRIENAIAKYQKDHNGNLPDRLSELFPDYVNSSNAVWFFWPPISEASIKASLDSKTISKRIDDEGAYMYLGSRGSSEDILLYDRTNLWSPSEGGMTVVTVTTNLTTLLRSIDDVNSRLSRLAIK